VLNVVHPEGKGKGYLSMANGQGKWEAKRLGNCEPEGGKRGGKREDERGKGWGGDRRGRWMPL